MRTNNWQDFISGSSCYQCRSTLSFQPLMSLPDFVALNHRLVKQQELDLTWGARVKSRRRSLGRASPFRFVSFSARIFELLMIYWSMGLGLGRVASDSAGQVRLGQLFCFKLGLSLTWPNPMRLGWVDSDSTPTKSGPESEFYFPFFQSKAALGHVWHM